MKKTKPLYLVAFDAYVAAGGQPSGTTYRRCFPRHRQQIRAVARAVANAVSRRRRAATTEQRREPTQRGYLY